MDSEKIRREGFVHKTRRHPNTPINHNLGVLMGYHLEKLFGAGLDLG